MASAHKLLGKGGIFHKNLQGFTPRRVQQEMAVEVESALKHGGNLVVESGTGTGKTFAYLIPVIESGKRTIISTGTKHLQEQIFFRDLPTVLDVLDTQVNAVLLKGRSNYLCRYRLKLNSQQSDLIGRTDQLAYDAMDNWANRTTIGDISEVSEISEDSRIWSKVTSTAENCLGGKCPDFSRCFVNQARQRALKADIVVVNHHLFFSDITLKTEGFGELLPDHEAVIFDEAHTIADTATYFFGYSVSSFQLKELIADILAAEQNEQSGVNLGDCIGPVKIQIERFQAHCKTLENDSVILADLINKQFDQSYARLCSEISMLVDALEIASPAGEDLGKCYSRATQIYSQLAAWREDREKDSVCWLETGKGFFRFNVTPLNIGKHFDPFLSNPEVTWIFTSATLAVGDNFSSFCGQIGLHDVETHCWESPYDYQDNSLLYLPNNLPDPRDATFNQALVDVIMDVTNASFGRAFCLFTSHAMMQRVYRELSEKCRWPLFLQGQAAKQHLLKQFLDTENSILLGTASFWGGVDVKGQALSCVIIDKLPFEPPSNPVLKSRLQICEENNGVPFMDIQVPNAVISLKQGAGRLIRSEMDRGVLVICDSRISTKSYGKLFLDSLPPMPVTRNIEEVYRFFR